MKLKTLTQSQYFDSSLKNYAPIHSNFEHFKTCLVKLLGEIDENESEGYNENLVQEFLQEAFYRPSNLINKKDRKDLVIYGGLQNSSKVEVLLEVKRPNSSEMISEDNPNKKALQQLLYYFLRERVDEDNGNIKRLIATDAYNWFIFDAALFEKAFYQNKKLIKDYKAWRDGKKSYSDTSSFYKEIAEKYIAELETLESVHINIKDFEKLLDKDGKANSTKLTSLYKLFSPKYLLKKSFLDDNNELKPKFYNELLHIIGLEETKEKNKLLIKRKSEANRNSGSLLELAIAKLETEYTSYDFEYIQDFGKDREERIYEIALELCLTWINRILFLKLLEAQLVSYHQDNKDYKFLNTTKIPTFNELYKLFHNVLATKLDKRLPAIKEEYSKIPYLNSSLFDFAEVENKTLKISGLDDGMLLEFIGKTALKDERKKSEGLDTLDYLFKFLDKHDFSTVDTRIIRDDDRTLINASVLGKVFEKINGYKDGAVFTPAFITMYMCRQAIRLAVLQKFKDETDFNSEDFEELKIYIGNPYEKEKIKEYNRIIDGLKLCDPAVGSGHFLVSALNEIIAIKSELNILASGENKDNPAEDYKPIREYKIIVSDDELDIRHKQSDEVFRYEIFNDKPTEDAQFIQKTLFHEKQKLIENCLFGVDINPNSVKICRLRLWIELLKNAYYRPEENFTDLETLPNIDINIKEGNSLISRFSLDENLSKVLKKAKLKVKDYRDMVRDYKETRDQVTKRKLEATINQVKEDIKVELFHFSPARIKRREIKGDLDKILNQPKMFEESAEVKLKEQKKIEKLQQNLAKQDAIIKQIEENKIYENAFEWRFEFPEVLSDDGKFLGFDAVIGNPPYIRQEQLGELKQFLKKDYEVYTGTADILVYFYELGLDILKDKQILSYITSNKFMRAKYGKPLRQFLWKNNLTEITDFGELPVFDEASTFPVIVSVEKAANNAKVEFTQIKDLDFLQTNKSQPLEQIIKETSTILNESAFDGDNWLLADTKIVDLINKLQSKGVVLEDYIDCDIRRGIITGFNTAFIIDEEKRIELIEKDENSAEIIFPYAVGDDFRKYELKDKKRFIILTKIGVEIERFPAIFEHLKTYQKQLEKRWDKGNHWWELRACAYYDDFLKPKIVYPDIAKESRMTLVKSPLYFGNTAYFISSDDKYLLSILNSNTIFFYYSQIAAVLGDAQKGGRLRWFTQDVIKIPIPKISPKAQEPFIKLVVEILEKKKDGKDTEELEAKIDKMVYKLYDLTAEEIAIVEGKD